MALPTSPVQASSHREAPGIGDDPTADNTDVYLFRDTVDPTMVNVIANFIPFEEPQGGPNFYKFSDEVKYSIGIDNNGDVKDDITFNVRFRTAPYGNSFLYNNGPVTTVNDPNLLVNQTYSVERVTNSGSSMLITGAEVAPINVGIRTNAQSGTGKSGTTLANDADTDYNALAQQHVKNLAGGGKVFAGPRDDAFFVDTGSVFDLLGLRPLNTAHLLPTDTGPGRDGLGKKNVHTISFQLPIASVTSTGALPTSGSAPEAVIGVYSYASRQRVKVLSVAGGAPRTSGRFVQVSRLAIPLVNEVLIPLNKKDLWNSVKPADDAQFFGDILDPEPTKLYPVLYPGISVPQGGFTAGGDIRRKDLVTVLTGGGSGVSLPPADLLRLNLFTVQNTAPNGTVTRTAGAPAGNSLGVINGDGAGFPNGRRLFDDVTDVELRLLAGGTVIDPNTGALTQTAGTGFNVSPNNALTDGVDVNDRPFMGVFPYQGIPWNGYSVTEPGYAAQ